MLIAMGVTAGDSRAGYHQLPMLFSGELARALTVLNQVLNVMSLKYAPIAFKLDVVVCSYNVSNKEAEAVNSRSVLATV